MFLLMLCACAVYCVLGQTLENHRCIFPARNCMKIEKYADLKIDELVGQLENP